jgi:hypothetical protein
MWLLLKAISLIYSENWEPKAEKDLKNKEMWSAEKRSKLKIVDKEGVY